MKCLVKETPEGLKNQTVVIKEFPFFYTGVEPFGDKKKIEYLVRYDIESEFEVKIISTNIDDEIIEIGFSKRPFDENEYGASYLERDKQMNLKQFNKKISEILNLFNLSSF